MTKEAKEKAQGSNEVKFESKNQPIQDPQALGKEKDASQGPGKPTVDPAPKKSYVVVTDFYSKGKPKIKHEKGSNVSYLPQERLDSLVERGIVAER